MIRKAQAKVDFILDIPAKKIEKSNIVHDKIVAAAGTFATPDLDMVTFKKDIDGILFQMFYILFFFG